MPDSKYSPDPSGQEISAGAEGRGLRVEESVEDRERSWMSGDCVHGYSGAAGVR